MSPTVHGAFAFAFGLLIAGLARATPPAGGFAPLEQVVSGACRLSESVAVVRVSALRVDAIERGEKQTATLEVVRMIRGEASAVPAQRFYTYSIPPETDSFPTRVKSGGEYVIFLSRANPGFESLLPTGIYSAEPLERVIALAQSACGG